MIWIHGGANWLEGSRLSVYDGGALAGRGDLVVASLNYRLGLFGFLDVSVLGGVEYAGTHSLGLRDQLAAIKWICANAAAFGGDPDNVTVIGLTVNELASALLARPRMEPSRRSVESMALPIAGENTPKSPLWKFRARS